MEQEKKQAAKLQEYNGQNAIAGQCVSEDGRRCVTVLLRTMGVYTDEWHGLRFAPQAAMELCRQIEAVANGAEAANLAMCLELDRTEQEAIG